MTQPIVTSDLLISTLARLQEANALRISTTEDLEAAAELFSDLKRERDDHERARVAEKEPHLEAGRAVDARWKPVLTTLDSAAAAIASKIKAFKAEMDRKAEEEQRRLRAQQERERARLAKQAEKAEARGLTETADALIREAETMQPAIVTSAMPPRTAGLQLADNWTFVVEDEGLLPREYLVPDLVAIRRTVKALKGRTAIPGVRVFNEATVKRGR